MGQHRLGTAMGDRARRELARLCTRRHLRRVLVLGLLFYAASFLLPRVAHAAVSFDIVYVRWPRAGDDALVMLPQGEDPFRVSPGADLVMLHPDGSQRVLVDCDRCCVQDPMVSFDGEWVYYTKMLDATNVRSPSFLFKMRIAGPAADFREVQLTFDDGFESRGQHAYAGSADDLSSAFSIRDMGPAPLPGGKIAFTSNRPATIAFHQGTHFSITEAYASSTLHLFVLDDHDGSLTSAALSNLYQIGFGNLHMALHPIVLRDGRILFSNWDDAGGKFVYAMTTLYAIHPDGSNLVAITEPHDHHKNVDHFATQLASGAIVTGQYYPSFDFGFGHLCRFPLDVPEPAYTRDPSRARNTYNGGPISWRSFERKGWESLTPHTAPDDCPAPNLSGKYAMPCAAPQGALLVAYSPGGVNHFSGCNGGTNHYLDSGLYLISDAEAGRVTDPRDGAQLELILNSPEHNEIWPRAVVAYEEIHGIAAPQALTPTDSARPADDRLEPGEPHAIVGTSSLYNRESAPLQGDPFRQGSNAREIAAGAWLIQGTDAGAVRSAEIHAVRIVGVVPKPYRRPIDKYGATTAEHARWSPYIPDARSDRFVEGYASAHAERWEILAEIPVRKVDAQGNPLLDPRGDPDTSFATKIPANTPFFYQGIDQNGMTLFSELTWRSAVPGEVRTDCGGCHAHSIASVPFEGTAAHRRLPIQARGIDPADPMIAAGLWDVTRRTPLISSAADGTPTVRVVEQGMVDFEYFRDVQSILQARCVSCHRMAGNTTGTDLAFDGSTASDNAYFRLVKDSAPRFGGPAPGGGYMYPQLSKYVRANQARQSLLVWKLFGRRLDGRGNGERQDDLDFTPHTAPHGATIEECRTIARWIDLGCPMDFQGALHEGYRYTDDNLLPVLNVCSPARGGNPGFDGMIRIGATDAESGVDWSSLEVRLDASLADGIDPQPVPLVGAQSPGSSGVVAVALTQQLSADRPMLLVVSIRDRAGNQRVDSRRFWLAGPVRGAPPPPPPPLASPTPPPAPPPAAPLPAPPPAAPEDPPPVEEPPTAPPGGGADSTAADDDGGGGGCATSRGGDPAALVVLLLPAALALLRRRPAVGAAGSNDG